MDTPAKARQIGEDFAKARRAYDSALELAVQGRHRDAVARAYEASLLCGEAAVSVEGFDPKTRWGAWIQFGYLFLCHARVSRGLGRMVDVIQGRTPDGAIPEAQWERTCELALTNTKNIFAYFGGYIRARAADPWNRPRAHFG